MVKTFMHILVLVSLLSGMFPVPQPAGSSDLPKIWQIVFADSVSVSQLRMYKDMGVDGLYKCVANAPNYPNGPIWAGGEWRLVERVKGTYDWSSLRACLDHALAANLWFIPEVVINVPPDWFLQEHPNALLKDARGITATDPDADGAPYQLSPWFIASGAADGELKAFVDSFLSVVAAYPNVPAVMIGNFKLNVLPWKMVGADDFTDWPIWDDAAVASYQARFGTMPPATWNDYLAMPGAGQQAFRQWQTAAMETNLRERYLPWLSSFTGWKVINASIWDNNGVQGSIFTTQTPEMTALKQAAILASGVAAKVIINDDNMGATGLEPYQLQDVQLAHANGFLIYGERVPQAGTWAGIFQMWQRVQPDGFINISTVDPVVLAQFRQFYGPASEPPPSLSLAQFDDSDPNLMRLATDQFELSLRKNNGSIDAIFDKVRGVALPVSSRNGCLWGMSYVDDKYLGGCSFDHFGANQFSYRWDPSAGELKLIYTFGNLGAAEQANAEVTLIPSADAYFDLKLTLQNLSQLTVQHVYFPSDLLLSKASITQAYLPFALPGVRLNQSFFTAAHSVVRTYPTFNAFADFQYAGLSGDTSLAYYSINPIGSPIAPVSIGYQDDEQSHPGMTYLPHSYHVNAAPGATWQSPTVRVWLGKTIQEMLLAYRADNGIDAYPSLIDKLGGPKFEQMAKAPLIKAEIRDSLSNWPARLDRIPAPALIHLVGFHDGGFDHNYPDFLPPAPAVGTMAGLRSLVLREQAKGNLIIPYTNPTWWDDTSPTTLNELPAAGLAIQDIAVITRQGEINWETYNQNKGYVVSPGHPYVSGRLDRLMEQWQTDIPVDCVFEDQVGARGWREDFNPSSAAPLAYSDGWLAHTQTYAQRCLMTEMGWDRLASTETGFTGSLLVPFADTNNTLGVGNWEPYPLANWLFQDKVLFYQHDLEPFPVTGSSNMLVFNLAFGMMLSYLPDWPSIVTVDDPLLYAVSVLQQRLVYRMAGSTLQSFDHLTHEVTRSVFSSLEVTANWSASQTYDVELGRVAPKGFFAVSPDGNLAAGMFNGEFNGRELNGEHLILLEKNAQTVDIWMPLGEDTLLTVPIPASAPADGKQRLSACAYRADGARMGCQWVTPSNGQTTFWYAQHVAGQRADHYRVQYAYRLSLPMLSR